MPISFRRLAPVSSLPALFLALATPAVAQIQIPQPPVPLQPGAANAEGVVIQDVRVEGLQRIEPGTVFSYLPIRVKDP